MPDRRKITVDGNEAVASVAHRLSEVIAIYPITPSSNMGELSDEWSAKGRTNIWGQVPDVVEMQSEGGAIAAVHGALQAGTLATTFTASQGLLLMIPSMYKIAGELTPFAMHVAARTVATHALSIFGDHSDVMGVRQTGFALLASGSVQEAQDLALVAHAATLRSRIPFLHFFDGFRTSHEIAKIEELTDDDLRALVPEDGVREHRLRALTPDRPVLRGSAQNPDTYFQAREACNLFYETCPGIVRETMEAFGRRTGRPYGLFDYAGDPEADRVIVMMGSGAEVAHETVDWLRARGEKVGVLKVRLYRPFDVRAFAAALPRAAKTIAVLDRTKEPGATGDPLFLDVVAALREARDLGLRADDPRVVSARYGLSGKEFTPAMVVALFQELAAPRPRTRMTIGIMDDIGKSSLPWDRDLDIEPADTTRAIFWGLGSDGTVGANKNSIAIIGERTPLHAQGYFVYDSKKSGAMTVSHLRFGPRPIRSSCLIRRAGFVACHQFAFLDRYDVLEAAAPGGVFLLNSPFPAEAVWDELPREVQETILARKLRVFVIDALAVAQDAGMGSRINTVMQTCFFAISGVLPKDEAIREIKEAIRETYGKKGEDVVRKNWAAVDRTLANLHEVRVPAAAPSGRPRPPAVADTAPEFVRRVTARILANQGDLLPVSAFPVDGTWPTATAQWEKRNIATEIPVWDETICVQCNRCVFVCPHATIRAKVVAPAELAAAPASFQSADSRLSEYKGQKYTLQVAPEDCTGCGICVEVCPARDKSNPRHKAIDMAPQRPIREQQRGNWDFFLRLPEVDRTTVRPDARSTQFLQPLFEFSGACAGCGETPYIKLLTQLFGDRLLIANATGCTSIYGGNLPTTPYTVNSAGRGPAWANSLFEDNAEFGFGFRLALDARRTHALSLVKALAPKIGEGLAGALTEASNWDDAGMAAQRDRVVALRTALAPLKDAEARRLDLLADALVKKSVWLIGGDGWAYDIGFGGLDHVMASNREVRILVLDTEVYSNTGGQQSKATPLGASAKFATAGKSSPKKDLGLMAMSYSHAYVARVAFGANDRQTVQALLEADAFPGPAIIIAYSHCIAHGYDMAFGAKQQKLAVDSGIWPLYRFDPRRPLKGEPPLHLDSGPPRVRPIEYLRNEARFRMVEALDPARFRTLMKDAQRTAAQRWDLYRQLAGVTVANPEPDKEE
ncbi:MAG: pyruvate:ferredoxin (flavodoxin) oxidoreductase [Candidatus Brocadiae bacterium]|nr:pyruvate:ferredoxin (flavodoxin) oxidoreductase [Candidatus Brocadiia bacterium]